MTAVAVGVGFRFDVGFGFRRCAALCAAFLLSACAVVPKGGESPGSGTLSGRFSVRVDATDGAVARSVSAAFELLGSAISGQLNLTTPLGTVLAQARWAPGQVVLVTPKGETNYPDLDALTRELLGEGLPVAALFDWLRGRPWPGAVSTPTSAAGATGFEQLGWVVDLARFDEAWVAARRERAPVVTLRAKLDRP